MTNEKLNELLNECINILTHVEHLLDETDKKDFDDLCKLIIRSEDIQRYHQGQLIIYDGLPYIINEIDYDDLTILISDGQMMDNYMWIDDLENITT
jgi:hypothetical protein